jgi:hypothetical protein
MDIQTQALYKHHRMTGKAIGTGTMQVNGEERQAVILATDERTRTAYPVENVMPASLNDVANDLFAEISRAIDAAVFLGLDRAMIERVLQEALAEAKTQDSQTA